MNTKQEKKGLEELLKLANDSSYRAVRYRWLSILITGAGFFLLAQIFIATSNDYQPVTNLVYLGIAAGFFAGLGYYFTAVRFGSKFLSPYLDKEKLEKRINEINS